jgi:hypothetical protein
MEPGFSVPYSQQPATGTYRELHYYSPNGQPLFLEGPDVNKDRILCLKKTGLKKTCLRTKFHVFQE